MLLSCSWLHVQLNLALLSTVSRLANRTANVVAERNCVIVMAAKRQFGLIHMHVSKPAQNTVDASSAIETDLTIIPSSVCRVSKRHTHTQQQAAIEK